MFVTVYTPLYRHVCPPVRRATEKSVETVHIARCAGNAPRLHCSTANAVRRSYSQMRHVQILNSSITSLHKQLPSTTSTRITITQQSQYDARAAARILWLPGH